MKKTLSVFVILFIWTINGSATDSALVSIPFKIFDNFGGEKTLYFGLDESASDSVDTHLGESDLPPFPPVGAFEARWILPNNNFNGSLSSYLDYRNAQFPFSGIKEHRVRYQARTEADTLYFSWNLPIGVTAVLQDIINGEIINVSMNGTGMFGFTFFQALNQLKVTITYNAITSVELTSFYGKLNDKGILLDWTTTSETNNMGFEIERAWFLSPLIFGSQWEIIGFVPGNGSTSGISRYSFTDENITAGFYKYRLKQIDFDGTFNYSETIEVESDLIANEFILYQNFPNPFNPSTTISWITAARSFVSLKVYDLLGQEVVVLVNDEREAGSYSLNFDASQLNSGTYFYCLKVKNNDGKEYNSTKKMIFIK